MSWNSNSWSIWSSCVRSVSSAPSASKERTHASLEQIPHVVQHRSLLPLLPPQPRIDPLLRPSIRTKLPRLLRPPLFALLLRRLLGPKPPPPQSQLLPIESTPSHNPRDLAQVDLDHRVPPHAPQLLLAPTPLRSSFLQPHQHPLPLSLDERPSEERVPRINLVRPPKHLVLPRPGQRQHCRRRSKTDDVLGRAIHERGSEECVPVDLARGVRGRGMEEGGSVGARTDPATTSDEGTPGVGFAAPVRGVEAEGVGPSYRFEVRVGEERRRGTHLVRRRRGPCRPSNGRFPRSRKGSGEGGRVE